MSIHTDRRIILDVFPLLKNNCCGFVNHAKSISTKYDSILEAYNKGELWDVTSPFYITFYSKEHILSSVDSGVGEVLETAA